MLHLIKQDIYDSYLHIGITLLLSLLLLSCCTTEPGDPPEVRPPGYQDDIPWPSLADSPWPMFRNNPQGTGRNSAGNGDLEFIKDWQIDIEGPKSFMGFTGIAIGEDSTIYIGVSYEPDDSLDQTSYLYAIDYSGNIKWKFGFGTQVVATTPLIINSGNIIIGSYDNYLYCLNDQGEVVWKTDVGSGIHDVSLNIDLTGNIYFVANNQQLYSVSPDGNINWILNGNNDFGSSTSDFMVFSPDGSVVYVQGYNNLIIAVSTKGEMLWKYTNGGRNITMPICDNNGNIYFGFRDAKSGPENGIISLNKDGSLNWLFESDVSYSYPCLDRNGNLYFSGNSGIFSITLDGELRWINNLVYSDTIICDNYFLYTPNYALDFSGNIIAEYGENLSTGSCPAIAFGRLFIPYTYPGKSIIAYH